MEYLILIWFALHPGAHFRTVQEARKAKMPEEIEQRVEVFSTSDTAKLMDRIQSIGVKDFEVYRARKGKVQMAVDLGQ